MEIRHPAIARAAQSLLLLIDCQERLWKVMAHRQTLEASLRLLLRGARLLGIPVLATEQNPAGLGPTIAALKEEMPEATILPKTTFSCLGEPAFVESLRSRDRTTLVLCGIEAHICVLQTALDALAAGYDVQVVADGCGTRIAANHGVGLRRAEQAGAVITTVESVLFEWMERCDAPAFKKVIDLLR